MALRFMRAHTATDPLHLSLRTRTRVALAYRGAPGLPRGSSLPRITQASCAPLPLANSRAAGLRRRAARLCAAPSLRFLFGSRTVHRACRALLLRLVLAMLTAAAVTLRLVALRSCRTLPVRGNTLLPACVHLFLFLHTFCAPLATHSPLSHPWTVGPTCLPRCTALPHTLPTLPTCLGGGGGGGGGGGF